MQYLPYFKVLEGKYFLNNHKWAKNEMTKVFGIKNDKMLTKLKFENLGHFTVREV